MKTKHSYNEIATNYKLWMEYADPSGVDSEEAFNSMAVEDKIAILRDCFGEEA